MSTPVVPPRPQRTQAGHTAVKNDTPIVPPRPTRKTDPSPDRENIGRSPLNGPPVSFGTRPAQPSSGRNSEELPRRPPSVSLPDIGQEGAEYSSFDTLPAEAHGVQTSTSKAGDSEQTSSVSPDLPMHQPRASVPSSTARRQIQHVTSTDSTQAAAAGIGRAKPADDVHKMPPHDAHAESPLSRVTSNTHENRRAPSTEPANALRPKASFSRSTPNLTLERSVSRPGSIHGDDREHGIPEIGVQVPLLAMAGDVQAPTPAQTLAQHSAGIGFFNDGSARAHHRKRSSRHEFGPPDSYGIRHDLDHQDQFEREWARKHPQEAAREEFHTHLPKPETALTSEQLNRLVQAEASAQVATPGTPDEHEAEEYLSRISSAAPSPALGTRQKRASSGSQTKPESPFRKTAFSSSEKNRLHPDDALDDEPSPLTRGGNSFYGEDHEHEHADGTPILAADELMKRPNSAFMHAAVTPDPDSHYDHYDEVYDSDQGRNSRRNSANPSSRPSSRPSSVHGHSNMQGYSGGSLHRFISHEETHHSGMGTPLEEIEEYEPLFPEDEENAATGPRKVFKKRPELAMHHFPSRDVWEDTPDSLQYSATVSTPELEKTQEAIEAERAGATASTFETPAQEAQRRAQNDKENDMTSDNKTFIKPHFKADVLEDLHRPGTHRFPSSDVWEDSPDSVRLVTTVSSPQLDETKSTPDDRPSTYAIPHNQDDDEARATTGYSSSFRPSVPSRPARSSKLTDEVKPEDAGVKSPPSIPAKPQVPARPQRPLKAAGDGTSEEAPAIVKAKPPVPARPGGEKIAALKAGFMSDLNNRLKIGPQAPPKKEVESESAEEEKAAPLADARKSRAKGPARRKPAATSPADRRASVKFAMSPLIHVWSIDEEDELRVHEKEKEEAKAAEAEKAMADIQTRNTDSAAPTAEVSVDEVASKISNADQPGDVARTHRESVSGLKSALANAGAAPASYAEPSHEEAVVEEKESLETTHSKDTAVQTGETEVTSTGPSGEEAKLTALLDAKAPEPGDVILKDGEAAQS